MNFSARTCEKWDEQSSLAEVRAHLETGDPRMASESANTFWAWPFSGDVTQDYRPFTSWWPAWFRTTMTQFGVVNIEEMQSNDPDLEKGIVNDIASYGKQLGRIVEALNAVCNHLDTGGWTQEEREAVQSFTRLADEIDAYKSAHQPVTKGSIDKLVAVLRTLREQDRQSYELIQERLRKEKTTDS
jgi:hypothetical protein